MTRPRHTFPKDYDLRDGVYLPREDHGDAFAYSDGDSAETYLLELIEKCSDRSVLSQELAAGIRDWPSRYHLSRRRANLLRPFEAQLRGSVLEVGAGCGALTRFLGENGGDIVAVEGSMRRSRIARARTADLANVSVVCDRIEAFASAKTFDAVLAVGVLEYAAIYGPGGERPHLEFLKSLRQALAPDGVVIIAIENKLGLKYFAGALEDHVGGEFHGINNSYGPDTVATFGRIELSTLLAEAGFAAQAFFYPCPDYKLPTSILSSSLLDRHSDVATTLVAQSVLFDPQRPPDPTFSLEQGWSNLGRNRLLGELANSFLVVAAASGAATEPYTALKSAGWHYSVDRHPAFTKETRFESSRAGLKIRRRSLSKVEAPPVPISCNPVDEPFRPGENWWMALSTIINRPGWSIPQLAAWTRVWIDALLQQCGVDGFDTRTLGTPVEGRHFDATPFNMTRDESDDTHFFDQEWQLTPAPELGYLVYRGLRDSLCRISSWAVPAAGTPTGINDIVVGILAECGVLVTRPDINRYVLMEGQVQAWVQGRLESSMSQDDAAHTWTVKRQERLPAQRNALVRDVQVLRNDLEQAQAGAGAAEQARQTLSEELARARDAAASQTAETARLSDLADERERAFAALQDQSSSQIGYLERNLETMRAFLRDSQSQSQSLAGELATAQNSLAQHREKAAQAETERNVLLMKAQQLETQLEQERAAKFQEASALQDQLRHEREQHTRDAQIGKSQGEQLSATLALQAREIDKLASSKFRWPFSNTAERIGRAFTPWKRTRFRQKSWEAGIIRDSRLFRPLYYLKTHPDVAATGTDPLLHYILHGAAEGRVPHPLFDPQFYAAQIPEAERSAMSPLAHYASAGVAAGLDPHPLFDTDFYLRTNPDVAAAGVNPLHHYMEHGWREGRDPNPLFDTSFYLERNPAAAASDQNPLVHYLASATSAAG